MPTQLLANQEEVFWLVGPDDLPSDWMSVIFLFPKQLQGMREKRENRQREREKERGGGREREGEGGRERWKEGGRKKSA